MSIEGSQWLRDGSESSDQEGKDSKPKEKNRNKAPESRWLRPPLPLEKLTSKEKTTEVGDEEEQKPEAEAIEISGPATSGFERATEEASELRDIPHFSEDTPFSLMTTESAVGQDNVPAGSEGVASEVTGTPAAEILPSEPWQSISGDSPFSRGWATRIEHTDATDSTRPVTSLRQSALTPSGAPAPRFEASAAPTTELSPHAKPSFAPETATGTGVAAVIETLKAAKELAEMASDPLPRLVRTVTELAVVGYLTSRKDERYKGLKQQLQQYDQRFGQVQQQHQQTNERLASHLAQTEAASKAQQPERILVDQEGNEIKLKPGWHVEVPAGGYGYVRDEHGRVVHDAIKYGEAFKREQQREQLSDDLFNAISGGSTIGVGSTQDATFDGQQPVQIHTQIPNMSGAQPTPPETVDLRHRLPRPHKPLAETFISPWLWTAVAILIIIYFIASLA